MVNVSEIKIELERLLDKEEKTPFDMIVINATKETVQLVEENKKIRNNGRS